MEKESYGIEDIQSLDFREGVRTRVQMYLGSDDLDGTYQAFKEIINNSTDEALAGFGKKIEITVKEEENTISVRDYGRGVPFGFRGDGENVLVAVFTKSHTGGKFDESVYKNASGLNGVGGSCVCLSSEKFDVYSIRSNVCAHAGFEKGINTVYEEFDAEGRKDGTHIIFKPDTEVFKNGEIGYSYEKICADIKDISYLYSGIEFVVSKADSKDHVLDKKIYCAKNGILDFIKEHNKKPLHNTIIHQTMTDGTDTVEIAFQWGDSKEKGYVFVNGLRVPEGGTPITGAKQALTRTFNSLAKCDFDGDMIREGLFYVINCSVAQPSFANQTKSKINNASLRGLTSTAFSDGLKEMKKRHAEEFDTIADMLKRVEKAEAAAERARQSVLESEREIEDVKRTKAELMDKLSDCKYHDDKSSIYICEGDSAKGAFVRTRDSKYVAVMPIRGKIINALKHPVDEVLDNEEVKAIIRILGCGIFQKCNPDKLRYGKVYFAADADPDGFAIVCLLLTLFHELMPQLIETGKVCWIQMPLYEVVYKDKTLFAYNDEELAKLPKGGQINRNKG